MRYHKMLIAAAGVAVFAAAPALAQTAQPSLSEVITSIQTSKQDATAIQSLSTVKTVNVVKVGELPDDGNKAKLDEAVTTNDADIKGLQTALTSNSAVNTALTQANVQVASVVAADIMPDGAITVYVR
jgi:hypothetical protein